MSDVVVNTLEERWKRETQHPSFRLVFTPESSSGIAKVTTFSAEVIGSNDAPDEAERRRWHSAEFRSFSEGAQMLLSMPLCTNCYSATLCLPAVSNNLGLKVSLKDRRAKKHKRMLLTCFPLTLSHFCCSALCSVPDQTAKEQLKICVTYYRDKCAGVFKLGKYSQFGADRFASPRSGLFLK